MPSAPHQQRSRDKRARLYVAARTLFAEQGYEAASIDAIAARAEMAIGTVYQHVRSKQQLLLCLMDDLLQQLSHLDRPPKAATGRRQVVHDLLAPALAAGLLHRGAYRAWQDAVRGNADLAQHDVAIHAWTTARMLDTLEFVQRLPRARTGVDLPALAMVLDRVFWIIVGDIAPASGAEQQRWIEVATQVVYHAVVCDPPRPTPTARRHTRT